MQLSLDNKTAIITGASQGLGFEISKKFLEAGASVMLCARNRGLLDQATQSLGSVVRSGRQVLAEQADVSEAADVTRVVQMTMAAFGHIDILVNNAGVYGPKGIAEEVDWQDWVRAIEINLFGSVLTCRAVLPHFKKQGHGKVIQLSGGGATNPLPRLGAYAVSKAAVIRFMETLAEEVRDNHIDVNAIAPGPLNTRMLEEILEAGPDKVGKTFYERSLQQKRAGGVSLENAAELAVFLASERSNGITGKLISAVWDPWTSLPEHLEDLRTSDIYTLRRIVPGDRGKTWGNDQ
jgi:NAD(P)-dependent dehydrogenase (short-subunit alcohol dehydrogenase family)